jgi:hypothetical protein
MENLKIQKEHSNHSNSYVKDLQKERCITLSKQMDSNHSPSYQYGSILNWGEIISSNLDIQLKKVQKEHRFYMSSYLLDVMCASQQYPSLGWKWNPNLSSIHVYYKMLWENKYKEYYE